MQAAFVATISLKSVQCVMAFIPFIYNLFLSQYLFLAPTWNDIR